MMAPMLQIHHASRSFSTFFHFPTLSSSSQSPNSIRPTLKPFLLTSLSRHSSSKSLHVLRSRPRAGGGGGGDGEAELELLGKPSPAREDKGVIVEEEEERDTEEAKKKPIEMEEALGPFLRFFKSREEGEGNDGGSGGISDPNTVEEVDKPEIREEKVAVEYYDPRPGDLVAGIVVSGNENKIDVNVGADLLGTMLTKEVLPLHGGETAHLLCDFEKDAEEFMVPGKMGIVRDDEALEGERLQGRPVVEVGTILFAEVLGRTLSGRPLLSTRRMFRRVAWHRVRQIKQLNEPIEVRIIEWNTGGLLTRIEGLRAFLPKTELMNKVHNFTDLKQNVGRQIYVCISKVDDINNELIISEREAWDIRHLQEGTLLEGTVRKIFPFGAQVMIGETNRSGLLHISNITRARVESVGDLLKVDEKVKVLVVKSMFPDKISLSIADLESEPGLFMSNKEKVFSEAEMMAEKYKSRLPAMSVYHKSGPPPENPLPFDDESRLYANWKWFKFERDNIV